jgi:hypothetical protein
MGMAARQHRTLHDARVLHYLASGETLPQGTLWRWFARRGG